MASLPAESIDFAMTSPPYWGLRDYGVKGQIGLEKHPQEYVDKLVSIFSELKRALKPHGSFYLNLGDTYCSMKGACVNAGGGENSILRHAYKQLKGVRNPNRMLKPDGGWLQPKQLLLIPSRVAAAMQEDGWILRNDIIWYKPNGLPNSVKDRLTNKYEHIFHFVKSRRYFYDLDAIRLPHKRGTKRAEHDFRRMMSGRQGFGGKWRAGGLQQAFVAGNKLGKNPGDIMMMRNKTSALTKLNSTRLPPEPDEPHAFHVLGKNPGDVVKLTRHDVATGQGGRGYLDSLHRNAYHLLGKNPGDLFEVHELLVQANHRHDNFPGVSGPSDFWRITTKPFPEAHFAVYPEELCVAPILSSCPPAVCKKCRSAPLQASTKRRSLSMADWRFMSKTRNMPVERAVAHVSGGHTGLLTINHMVRPKKWATCDCKAGFEPGIVFDPFAGAGTTLLVAKKLGRRWFGCELNPKFVRMATRRLKEL